MKKLLYIGHDYHNTTKSTQFLQQLLSQEYEIFKFDFDPYKDSFDVFSNLKNQVFDVVVLFQIMPSIYWLKQNITAEKIVFFPMYDGIPSLSDTIWLEYADVKIINFSKTLHNELTQLGFDSHYIQYFPKPLKIQNEGAQDSVFFWKRIDKISIKTVEKVLKKSDVSHIHIHKAIDPEQRDFELRSRWNISYSEWFDTKEEMQAEIQKSVFYFAPRMFEGIGMSFLEAMAMGRIVIACNYPTMNEYIEDGKTGYLYDYKNPKPIKIQDIRKIQKQIYAYIQNGYKVWEKNKVNILKWMQDSFPKGRVVRIKKVNKCITKRIFLFGFIPLYKIKNSSTKSKHSLFGCIPFLKVRIK